jgi:hypothetical protein
MYRPSLDGSIPGTVPTKKYPGNRAYHKGAFGSPPAHSHEPLYKREGKDKTKSMKQIYAEMPRRVRGLDKTAARKLRLKLAEMKMPIPAARSRNGNPKKTRSARRPRHIVWPSEQNSSPRYRYDGTVKE